MPRHDPLLTAVRKSIEQYDMLAKGDRVLVAVSGGQDSVCLLHALRTVGEKFRLTLEVAHLNHGLRGEASDADQAFMEQLAGEWELPLHVERADIARRAKRDRVSVEVAGRNARREFLLRVAGERGIGRIATAHTASDRAETVLMNILRGCGLAGLRSIQAVSRPLIRPLIGVKRQETEDYCRRHGLAFRVDASNLDPEHTLRNKIRLELLPLLEREYATGAVDALLRLADIATEELDWTEPLVDDALAKVVDEQGRISRFLPPDWPRALANRVTEEYLRRLTEVHETGRITTEQLTALLLGGGTGQQVSLPGNLIAKKGYHTVSVGAAEPKTPAKPIPARPVLKHGTTRVPELGVSLRQQIELADPGPGDEQQGRAVFDYHVVHDGMWVRTWREGDRFKPLGAPGTKKLQDFFVNQKVPQELRHRIPLVVAPGGEVLWVVGYRISDNVKVTGTTRIYLVVTVTSD